LCFDDKGASKVGALWCLSSKASETFERFREMFANLFTQPPRDLACWQRNDEGSDRLHRLRKERVGGKVKMERTVGLFQTILLASALRAGAPWVFSSPGRMIIVFPNPIYPTSHTYDWFPFANQFHSSA
jgi:hypothetical protein